MANPHPTPKLENLRRPWPPGTSGNPAGYSRGRRISDAIERLISVLPRDLVSVEVAAGQVGAHPETLLIMSTFPVLYPVRAQYCSARILRQGIGMIFARCLHAYP